MKIEINDTLLYVNGSFDVKKTLDKPFIEFNFFLCKNMDQLTLGLI